MADKRILLLPTGSRTLQVELIYRHTAMGNRVFVPKQGTYIPDVKPKLEWEQIATWPTLLSSSPDSDTLNVDTHAKDYRVKHGEDSFVSRQRDLLGSERPEMKVSIVDAASLVEMEFDLCHVFRGTRPKSGVDFARRHLLKHGNVRRWITSEMRPGKWMNLGSDFHEDCLITQPSGNDFGEKFKYRWNLFPSRAQLVALNLPDTVLSAADRADAASFNHNYQRRYQNEFRMFNSVNEALRKDKRKGIVNYGANKSGGGSDIRTSKPKENKPTLSCREALDLKRSLRCVVHLKGGDVGGGVVWYSLLVGTPMIVMKQYYKVTGMFRYFENNKHCVVVNDIKDIKGVVDAIKMFDDDAVLDDYVRNITELRNSLCGLGDLERFVDERV